MDPLFSLRLAREEDVPALEALIPLSVHGLQADHYSPAQREAALGPVFGVDLFGGDHRRSEEDPALDPAREPARIRAFFVRPDRARRGLGHALLHACESALRAAGFHDALLVATLPGEALYAARGYAVAERYEVALSGGLKLPVVRMTKNFRPDGGGPCQNSAAGRV